MKCAKCGKNEAVQFNGKRYFRTLDYNWIEGKRYVKQIYFCKECSDKFKAWLEEEGYAERDIPLTPVGKVSKQIVELMKKERDLKAQVESLGDILAEKDHKIMDLEAALAEYQREKHT